MQASARAYVAAQVARWGPFRRVLEVGSRDVNGTVRDLFVGADYVGVDIVAGDGVDVVCDATVGLPVGPYDCVVCCETFEHVQEWPRIVMHAWSVLAPGGVLIVTAAGPGWAEHSAVDGGPLRGGEWYRNVGPDDLCVIVEGFGFRDVQVDVAGSDVRCVAVRPGRVRVT